MNEPTKPDTSIADLIRKVTDGAPRVAEHGRAVRIFPPRQDARAGRGFGNSRAI